MHRYDVRSQPASRNATTLTAIHVSALCQYHPRLKPSTLTGCSVYGTTDIAMLAPNLSKNEAVPIGVLQYHGLSRPGYRGRCR